MSGLQALEKLRAGEAAKHIPVVVVSGHATVHDAVFLVSSISNADLVDAGGSKEVRATRTVSGATSASAGEPRPKSLVKFSRT